MSSRSISPPPTDARLRCWAEVDLSALRHNARRCRELAGDSCRLMAIVKADAYGHGLPRVVETLADDVAWFGVANVREARRTREAAAGRRGVHVLILSPATPAEIEPIVREGFSASVSSPEEVAAFETAAARHGVEAGLHAVADTGMGRMGARAEDFSGLVEQVRASPHCRLEGMETHFPSADEEEAFTLSQIESFEKLLRSIGPFEDCQVHLGNSAGLLGYQGRTPFATLVRPGLAIYGISPLPELDAPLRPALSLKTRVTLVRDIPAGTSISYGRTFVAERPMRVATLGVGYGDGYPRHLSGSGAEVLVAGRRCPLLGRVTMDQIVVDVSEAPAPVAGGDEAVLIGEQGAESIRAAELASRAGTIPWEILTGITGRVERVYRDG